jgi:predicted nucleotidyltransferase
MKNKKSREMFTFTNSLKILAFLAEKSGREFLGSEIQKAVNLSRAGVYLSTKELAADGLININVRGKIRLYSFDGQNPVSKQYKVILNLILIEPLIVRLREISKAVILYGSASRGEDDESSDIDLFILSHDPESVKRVIVMANIKRKIQPVIKTPVEFSAFKDKEKTYATEVARGITVWENNK